VFISFIQRDINFDLHQALLQEVFGSVRLGNVRKEFAFLKQLVVESIYLYPKL